MDQRTAACASDVEGRAAAFGNTFGDQNRVLAAQGQANASAARLSADKATALTGREVGKVMLNLNGAIATQPRM